MEFDKLVELTAKICHEANKAYCGGTGDASQLPWEWAPLWQKESARSGVLAVFRGEVSTAKESHESWLTQKRLDGWKYGTVKDEIKREHPCLVPYEDLPKEQQIKDYLFTSICNTMSNLI